jgi:chromosome segregation ATPase
MSQDIKDIINDFTTQSNEYFKKYDIDYQKKHGVPPKVRKFTKNTKDSIKPVHSTNTITLAELKQIQDKHNAHICELEKRIKDMSLVNERLNASLENYKKQNKTLKLDNLRYLDEIENLQQRLENCKKYSESLQNDKNILVERIKVIEERNADLIKIIRNDQRNIAEIIQALKDSQTLQAQSMKQEVLSLIEQDHSKKRHWWEFWKK